MFSSRISELTASNWSARRFNPSPRAKMLLSRRKNLLLTAFLKISVSRGSRDSNKRLLSLLRRRVQRIMQTSWTPRAQPVTHLVPSRLQPRSCSAPSNLLPSALISKTKQTRSNKSCRSSSCSQPRKPRRVASHSKAQPKAPKRSPRPWALARTCSTAETSQPLRRIYSWTRSTKSSIRAQKVRLRATATLC